MKQFHQEWWKCYHTSHFKVEWRTTPEYTKESSPCLPVERTRWPSQAVGFLGFYLYCPQFSVPFLIPAIHKPTFKQVKEKKGKKLLCFLKVSRSHRVVRQSLLQPLAAGAWVCGFESVTFQRCITLLSETASVLLTSLMCHVKTG